MFVLVPSHVWKCLGVFNLGLGQLPFDTFATDQPTDPFAFSPDNDRNNSGRKVRLGHLSSIGLDILAQSSPSI